MPLSEAVKRSVAAPDGRETLRQQPDIDAAIRGTIGDTYNVIGDPTEAMNQLRKRVLLDQVTHPIPRSTCGPPTDLPMCCFSLTRPMNHCGCTAKRLNERRSALGAEHPETAYALGGIGNVLTAMGKGAESISYMARSRQDPRANGRRKGPAHAVGTEQSDACPGG